MKCNLSLREISKIIREDFCLTEDEMLSRTRVRDVVIIRQIFHFFSYKYSEKSLSFIGNYKMKNYNHATILHSINTINNLCFSDRTFKETILLINNKLSNLVYIKTLKMNNFFDIDFINKKNELIHEINYCINANELKRILIKYTYI